MLDTNVVLYLLSGRLLEPLPAGELFLSVVSEMEMLSYPALTPTEEAEIRQFLAQVTVLGVSENIKNATIALRKRYRLKYSRCHNLCNHAIDECRAVEQ